jgi:hypothetical protein
VLDANISLLGNDDLRYAAATIVALTDNRALSSNMPKYCKKIKLRLGASDRIRTAEEERKDENTYQKPNHKSVVNLPINLLGDGPRHDNDHSSPTDSGRDLSRPAAVWRLRDPAIQRATTDPTDLHSRQSSQTPQPSDPASSDKSD